MLFLDAERKIYRINGYENTMVNFFQNQNMNSNASHIQKYLSSHRYGNMLNMKGMHLDHNSFQNFHYLDGIAN